MTTPKVIIFGPTGNIASVASRTAEEHGAHVYLAMRDPSKPIPGLTPEAEKAGNYTRLQADLTQPDTVLAALEQSGATRAFFYMARGSPDHMKSTIEAMKVGGVEYVVMLSSFLVWDPPKAVPKEELIGFLHAQVEISVEAVFGRGKYCAIRPGGFVTNSLQWKKGIQEGKLKLLGMEFKMDCITPGDMGLISGTILVKGTDEHAVYLYGPQNLPGKEVAARIAKVLGKDVQIEAQTDEEGLEEMKAAGYPPMMAEYLVKARNDNNLEKKFYEQGVANVKKYKGREGETLEEWIEGNKGLFA